MKINPINNSRYPIFTILKETVSTLGTKLKTLVTDVFQKEEIGGKYVTIDGKKYDSRYIPSCIGRDDDYKLVSWSRLEFYPEDIEKMKTMNIDERLEYKSKLLKEKRYIK